MKGQVQFRFKRALVLFNHDRALIERNASDDRGGRVGSTPVLVSIRAPIPQVSPPASRGRVLLSLYAFRRRFLSSLRSCSAASSRPRV